MMKNSNISATMEQAASAAGVHDQLEPEEHHRKPSSKHIMTPSFSSIPNRKTPRDNAKRFSDEQVKSLESMFSREAKLEPRNKMQLAKDLGLQPRQVSIWFQNKRARWKSKKLEQEYRVLKANFDALYKQFESLQKENASLLDQLHTQKGLLEDSHNKRRQCRSSRDSNENHAKKTTAPPPPPPEKTDQLLHPDHERREDDEGTPRHSGREKEKADFDIFLSDQQAETSSASASRRPPWCNHVFSGGLLDESCCPSSWWDF